jgi:hypothetical protein
LRTGNSIYALSGSGFIFLNLVTREISLIFIAGLEEKAISRELTNKLFCNNGKISLVIPIPDKKV